MEEVTLNSCHAYHSFDRINYARKGVANVPRADGDSLIRNTQIYDQF